MNAPAGPYDTRGKLCPHLGADLRGRGRRCLGEGCIYWGQDTFLLTRPGVAGVSETERETFVGCRLLMQLDIERNGVVETIRLHPGLDKVANEAARVADAFEDLAARRVEERTRLAAGNGPGGPGRRALEE